MLVIRVGIKIKPEEKDAFLAHMKRETVGVRKKFDGCQKYAVYADVAHENRFLLYEEWESQQNFDDYKNSADFKQSGQILFPMMAEPPDSAYFEAQLLP